MYRRSQFNRSPASGTCISKNFEWFPLVVAPLAGTMNCLVVVVVVVVVVVALLCVIDLWLLFVGL